MFPFAVETCRKKNKHRHMHLQDFAKEEEPRIAAVVALQGAQKIQ